MTTRILLILFCLSTAAPALPPPARNAASTAAESPRLTLPAGTAITVIDFDPKTGTFLLSLNETSAVGPNYALPEHLHRALGIPGDLRDFENQRPQMIGSIYTLKQPCPLVSEAEMAKREKKARPVGRAQ